MTVSPRRAREIARTRQDILEAAARAFAQNGFKDVTMQEIAREANYTAASLYSYFSSKTEIIRGLGDLMLHEVEAVFEEPFPPGISFEEKLRLLLRRQLEVASRRFELVALLHMGGAISDPERVLEVHKRRLDCYTAFLEEHATPADLGGHEPQDVSLMLTGLGGIFFLQWIVDPKEGWLEEKLQMILDFVLRGLGAEPR